MAGEVTVKLVAYYKKQIERLDPNFEFEKE